jgi:pectate lyase
MKLKIILFSLFINVLVYAQSGTTFQAEKANLFNANIESEHAGFTGTGYVNFQNEIGSYIEWIIPIANSGIDTLTFTYANGGTTNRNMELMINDSTNISQVDFNITGAWTNWNESTIISNFSEGNNLIRLTSLISEGGPNLDRLDITGEIGIRQYNFNVDIIGNGFVNIIPFDSLYDEDTDVTITAISESPWKFSYWLGTENPEKNPLVINIDRDYNITAFFQNSEDSLLNNNDQPIGFATIDTLGQTGTYGGEGGDTIVVTTGEQLFNILDSRRDSRFEKNYPPLILLVKGILTWTQDEMMDVKETYDLSILGVGKSSQIVGFGLNIFRSHNIIIRNIEFRDAPDDAINITNELSHHVWIDHCTFSDYPSIDLDGNDHDGLLDIKDGASFVTVSWNHFMNHRKTCIIGHSDNNGDTDIGRLKVTYSFNWFDNTISRHPRVRFGEVHVLNNYYDNSQGTMSYGIASTMDAKVFVEGNYFLNVPSPTHSGYANSGPGELVDNNNIFFNSGTPETLGDAFNPYQYYTYEATNPLVIPQQVMAYSGSGKLDSTETSIDTHDTQILDGYSLEQNFPNPFNPTTRIRFTLPKASYVNLAVYNSLGEIVMQLVNEEKAGGLHDIIFHGENLSSGIYFIELSANDFFQFKKMVLLK